MTRPSLVLLGGHLCTPALWQAQSHSLADVAECLPLELSGGSTMAGLAEQVLSRSPEKFSLAGFSMGGHVAMEIMRRAPHRVKRLALIDTRADVDSPERLRLRERDARLVQDGGFEALAAQLPDRWMSATHAAESTLRERLLRMVRAVSDDTRQEQLAA